MMILTDDECGYEIAKVESRRRKVFERVTSVSKLAPRGRALDDDGVIFFGMTLR
jgi:hypothetical protein